MKAPLHDRLSRYGLKAALIVFVFTLVFDTSAGFLEFNPQLAMYGPGALFCVFFRSMFWHLEGGVLLITLFQNQPARASCCPHSPSEVRRRAR
jgi:hypothetical protein